jgi:DNA-directed RNA polymerase specialized sigma subunit
MKKEYYIKLKNGQAVPVSEEIYREYMRPVWREAKRKNIRQNNEFSFEFMEESGMGYLCASEQKLVDEIVEDKLLLEMLMNALETLTVEERFLVNELFFNNKTERRIAEESNISHQAIHKRKNRILEKLKKYFE